MQVVGGRIALTNPPHITIISGFMALGKLSWVKWSRRLRFPRFIQAQAPNGEGVVVLLDPPIY